MQSTTIFQEQVRHVPANTIRFKAVPDQLKWICPAITITVVNYAWYMYNCVTSQLQAFFPAIPGTTAHSLVVVHA